MSQYKGYRGESLELLKRYGVAVGDAAKILADIAYSGIIMPRYEHSDDTHIVVKLPSGYNVGLDTRKIRSLEKLEGAKNAPREAHAGGAHKAGLPKVLLLSTGGTIASKIDYRTGAVTPLLTAGELNASIPELADIADIHAKEILAEYSENITPGHWLQIAEQVAKSAESGYAGVIVLHGTDTMHYTSAFLSFALVGFPVPIVLVGSQRSSDRASSDAALNLTGAARFIASRHGTRGVYVAMHRDENDDAVSCHIGTRVRKNHTSKRGAFETVGGSPAFTITQDGIEGGLDGEFFGADSFEPRIKLDSRVALLKYHPGFEPGLLDHIVDMGYRGVIFEGTGLGHIGKTMYESVKRAGSRGMFLGMTSQCIDGRVSMTVYESGRDLLNLGIIPLHDMIPEVALVKAMWAFGNYQSLEEVREIMLKNVASEMS